jgi:hypothetical protein
VYSAQTGAELFHFLAYEPQFRGGVRVAVGDVLGDGDQEIVTVPGPGTSPLVKVFSGSDGALIGEFPATPATYRGGLSVAVGDVSGSGHDEIITANDRGAPRVSIFSGANGGIVSSFMAYEPGYHDGVNVAVGDLDQTISYPGSNPNLSQIVDVSLDAEPYAVTDPAGQHSYAAYWYAGSSEPAITYGNSVGRGWSPLLPGNTGPTNPPQNLSSSYEQSWNYLDYSQSNQFDLNTYTPSPLNPVFNPVTLPTKSTPGADVTNSTDGAAVQLTQQNGTLQSYTGSFTTAGYLHGIRGITFAYQFQNAAPGDELTISIDGDLAFVMDASLVQSQAGPGTMTVGDLFGDQSHTLTFTLTSTQPNSTSSVIVSNLRQFADE